MPSPEPRELPPHSEACLRFESPEQRAVFVRVIACAVDYEIEPYEDKQDALFEAVRDFLGTQQQEEEP